jgi:hypothetical protein
MTLINRVLMRQVDDEDMLDTMVTWSDNNPGDWYYEAVQEATNSHDYTRTDKSSSEGTFNTEKWAEVTSSPNWSYLETIWATANDGAVSVK